MAPKRMATAKMFTARMRWRSVSLLVQPRNRPTLRSLFGKAVADAIERFDPVEAVVDGAELAAHALDVAVDRAVVDIDVVLIRDVHQLVAGLHHAGPLRQRLEDHEFGD